MIEIFHHDKFIATFQSENKKYILEYKNFDLENSISLSLPNTQKFYISELILYHILRAFCLRGICLKFLKVIL